MRDGACSICTCDMLVSMVVVGKVEDLVVIGEKKKAG